MALVTDAGTPGISDPAFLLIRECLKLDVKVESLPGATAFVPALINSGIPTNRFCFEGFLAIKERKANLIKSNWPPKNRTMIFYESPVRLVKTLEELITYFGESRLVRSAGNFPKCLKKINGERLREVATYFGEKTVKGEIVIVVAGKEK